MSQDVRFGNRNRPATPAAPAMMIADTKLSKDTHATGNTIAVVIMPAHQFGCLRSVAVMRLSVVGRRPGRIRREAESQEQPTVRRQGGAP